MESRVTSRRQEAKAFGRLCGPYGRPIQYPCLYRNIFVSVFTIQLRRMRPLMPTPPPFCLVYPPRVCDTLHISQLYLSRTGAVCFREEGAQGRVMQQSCGLDDAPLRRCSRHCIDCTRTKKSTTATRRRHAATKACTLHLFDCPWSMGFTRLHTASFFQPAACWAFLRHFLSSLAKWPPPPPLNLPCWFAPRQPQHFLICPRVCVLHVQRE